ACVYVSRSRRHRRATLFPYTTLFRSEGGRHGGVLVDVGVHGHAEQAGRLLAHLADEPPQPRRQLGAEDAARPLGDVDHEVAAALDRKSTRLNSSHVKISYAVFCLKKK